MTQINQLENVPFSGGDVSVRELVLRERIWRESVLIYGLGVSITAGLCAVVICVAFLI
jgi:hypothetical protein